jgi:hypothetical protein
MNNLGTFKTPVYVLAVLSVLTFFSGFLDHTEFFFIPSAMYFLISIGGIALVVFSLQSKASTSLRGLILLAGVSIALVGILANNGILGFKEHEQLLDGIDYR